MIDTTCPACGHAASGRFCSNCGAGLPGQVTCGSCGNEIPGGGRFCNQCGTPTPAAASTVPTPPTAATSAPRAATTPPSGPAMATTARPASTLPWVIAALAVLAAVVVLVLPRSDTGETGTAAPQAAAPASDANGAGFGDASAVDLSEMTPRERADRLFNRVMENVSAGDSAQAEFFLPMALAAYEEVGDLNADGHYHMAVLHLAGGDPAAARARADSILTETPTHLFGLFTAAQAEQAMGNASAARDLYTRFGSAFESESAAARAEYAEHQAVMPLMREEAAQALDDL